MPPLAERLGVPHELIEKIDLIRSGSLPPADELFEAAWKTAQSNPEQGQLLLATAILKRARETPEGRLASTLTLLAPLVAKADPMKTLGPQGRPRRDELMPNGWIHTTKSWPRLRYAWREGMRELLDVPDGKKRYGASAPPHVYAHPIVANAIDEVTRLSPSEPEPVMVSIKENFPPHPWATILTLAGALLTGVGIYREFGPGKKKH